MRDLAQALMPHAHAGTGARHDLGDAFAFAGHFGLDNLVLIYDSNDVTLDAMASKTQNEDTAKRYQAANWEVFTVAQGNELAPIAEALDKARARLQDAERQVHDHVAP